MVRTYTKQEQTALELFENGENAFPDTAQVLTLVTCSYEWDGARNIVVAVRE